MIGVLLGLVVGGGIVYLAMTWQARRDQSEVFTVDLLRGVLREKEK